jgi:hypothetical protein
VANYYLKNTGDWQTSATWSATDGGTALGSGYPTSGDSVFFTAHGNGLTCTVGETNTCASITASGSTTATLAGSSNLTVSGNVTFLSTMTMSYTGTLSIGGNFDGGGLTYKTVILTGSTCTIASSNIFNTLSFQPSATQGVTFTDTTIQIVTNFTRTGTGVITMVGSSTAGWYLEKSVGGTVSIDYLSLSYSNATPANTWYAGTHSTNTTGNTGWTFTIPPSNVGIAPTINTYIREDTPTTNFGNDDDVQAYDYSPYREYTLIQFNLSSLPGGTTVTAANMGLYWFDNYDSPPSGRYYRACRLRRYNWVEGNDQAGSGATWNTYDGTNNWTTAGALDTTNDIDTSITSDSLCPSGFSWLYWNIMSLVNDAIANHGGILNLKLYDSVENQYDAGLKWYSNQNGINNDLSPFLSINYSYGGGINAIPLGFIHGR